MLRIVCLSSYNRPPLVLINAIDNAPKAWTPSTEWEAKLKEINWSFDDGLPRFRHERWRDIFDKQLSSTPFTIQAADPLFSLPLGEGHVDFEHWLTREKIWDRLHTLSRISVLEGEVLEVSAL